MASNAPGQVENLIIIGSGPAGLTAAWKLKERGYEHVGVLEAEDICTRHDRGEGADYFAHHDLGRIMGEEDEQVAAWQAATSDATTK